MSGREAVVAEWRARSPQSAEEVAQFYATSVHMGDELADWHDTPERQAWTEFIVNVAKANNVRSAIDVGCGRGDDLRALRAAGVEHIVGIEPNEALRAECRKHDIYPWPSLHMAETWAEVFGSGFDLITCIDVIEHLPNAREFVDHLASIVKVGGILIESTATHHVDTPLHLEANWGWHPRGQLIGHGFALRQSVGNLNVWERVATGVQPGQSVLLATWRQVELGTMMSLLPLAAKNWGIFPLAGDALISRSRSILLTRWWRDTADDVCLMLDSDIVFTTEDAERIVAAARKHRTVVAAAYATRDAKGLASRIYPGTEITFHPDAEPVEVEYVATGFMAIHRDVVDALWPTLPTCHPELNWAFRPFFDCFVKDAEYLSEDWAFCERVRNAGFPVMLDPGIRLGHLGTKEYRIEDIGGVPAGTPMTFQEAPRVERAFGKSRAELFAEVR